MSGMRDMLGIALYRDAVTRGARSRGWPRWMPSMLLMPLMRSTPPFWMPARFRTRLKRKWFNPDNLLSVISIVVM